MNEATKTLVIQIEEQAIQYEMDYHGCGQAVIASLQKELNIGNEASFMAASFLGAGVVRSGETCGALISALMALGLVVGRRSIDGARTHLSFMPVASELRERFIDCVGHSLCREIQRCLFGRPYDLSSETEKQMFEDSGGHRRGGCPTVCGKAARIAAEIILEKLKPEGVNSRLASCKKHFT